MEEAVVMARAAREWGWRVRQGIVGDRRGRKSLTEGRMANEVVGESERKAEGQGR